MRSHGFEATPLPVISGPAEGVVKYRAEFTPGPAPDWAPLAELDAWRSWLFRLGLTGLDPARYDGLAYGNVSRRLDGRRFLISGTQTGGIERLGPAHYCEVVDFDTGRNLIVAAGPIRPSSEALTHAAAYQAADSIRCVLHGHSPDIWNRAESLGLPVTDPAIAYGTPEMAAAVADLLRVPETHVIVMGGHRDGIIAVGGSVAEAGLPLVRALMAAVGAGRESGMP